MRRASSSLLPHLTQCRITCRVVSREFFSDISPLSIKENSSPFSLPRLKSFNKTHGLFLLKNKTHQFQSNPSRNLDTLVDKPPHLSSKQREIEEKFEEAFQSATTTEEEILKAFEEMESAFYEKELGHPCLKVGLKLQGKDPEKSLAFANRALTIFDSTDKSSFHVAITLFLMGSVSYILKRFNDSLGYLNRATGIVGKLEKEGYIVHDLRPVLQDIHLRLANTKTAMGRSEEAIVDLRRCLELKEMALNPDSRELGVANRDLAEGYVEVWNFKEALPFCLKALEIHKAQFGNNSGEVANDRRLLGLIYLGLEEHEKALEQNELFQKISKNLGLNSDLLALEIDAALIQIALGKYDEAINTLKGVVPQIDKESETRARVFILMAKALCNQEKFAESKKCLEISCAILDKKETVSPVEVVKAYMEVSKMYETMNEFEAAIPLLKRSLAILKNLPHEKPLEGSVSVKIGWLLLSTGKVPQAIPYFESAAERLKESFGAENFGLGYIYNNLGAAYMELERPQSAAQMFAVAKDIMDVSLGPHHADSIEECQNLSTAYGAMGNYALAMEFQQRVIDAWESHGPSARYEFRKAHRLLEQLKKKARGSSSNEVPTKFLALPRTGEFVSTRSLKPDVQLCPCDGVPAVSN